MLISLMHKDNRQNVEESAQLEPERMDVDETTQMLSTEMCLGKTKPPCQSEGKQSNYSKIYERNFSENGDIELQPV
jgi:hypothetical protein